MANRKSLDQWLRDFKDIHGDKYDYSLITEIKGSRDRIDIICPIHGKFKQQASVHARHQCTKCGRAERSSKLKKTYKKTIVVRDTSANMWLSKRLV